MEMEYFIIFGAILGIVLTLTLIIFKLNSRISDLKYELKLGKINCQKDLDRLEERMNRLFGQSNSDVNHNKEIEKLDKLIKQINKLVDNRIKDVDSKKIPKD